MFWVLGSEDKYMRIQMLGDSGEGTKDLVGIGAQLVNLRDLRVGQGMLNRVAHDVRKWEWSRDWTLCTYRSLLCSNARLVRSSSTCVLVVRLHLLFPVYLHSHYCFFLLLSESYVPYNNSHCRNQLRETNTTAPVAILYTTRSYDGTKPPRMLLCCIGHWLTVL